MTVTIYYKQSDIAASLSELMMSPWALAGDGFRLAGIQEALHLVQDMINGEVPESLKIPAAKVVEVVRCQDCRYFKKFDSLCGSCKKAQGLPGVLRPESYCSRSEHEEG